MGLLGHFVAESGVWQEQVRVLFVSRGAHLQLAEECGVGFFGGVCQSG